MPIPSVVTILQAIHARAQQLLPLFIDGATPIDQDEPEWDLFVAVQELKDKSTLLVSSELACGQSYQSSL